MDTKFSVFNIFNTVGEYSRVSVDTPLFNAIAKSNPSLPYTTSVDGKDRPLRIFTINGLKVITRDLPKFNADGTPETYKGKDGNEYPKKDYFLYMKTAEALPLQTNKPDSIAKYDLACD